MNMNLSKFFYKIFILNYCFITDKIIISLFSINYVKKFMEKLYSSKLLSNNKFTLLSLFILGVALRLLFYFLIPSFYGLQSDSVGYYLSGVNGVNNGLYSNYWPPGFPILISAFYYIFNSNVIPILTLALIIIGVLIGLVTYYISLKLFNNRLAALLTFLFICIQPSFLLHSPQLLSDTFAVLIFGLSIYYILKDDNNKYSIIIGVLIGFLILIRPNYIFMIILYPLYLAFSNKISKIKISKIILFILALILTLTPWVIYTQLTMDEAVISTNGGVNFYIGNNPHANGRYAESYGLTDNNLGYQIGFNYITSNPVNTLNLYLKKLALLIITPYIMPWELPNYHFNISETIFSYGMNIGFIITELIGLRGLILIVKQKRLILLFTSIIILVNLTLIPFFVDGRLLMPLLLLYIILAGYYIAKVIDSTRNGVKNNSTNIIIK